MNGTDKRDRAVEQLLRQSLPSSQDEATEVCLDAETIAAWMDGGLSGAALEEAQMHAADCARCQALLSTFALLNSPVPAPASESRRWFAWLVPLTAAAAIGIWALLPRSQPGVPAQSGTMARNDEARAVAAPEAAFERAPQPTAAPPDPAVTPSAPPPARTLAAPRESGAPAAEPGAGVDRLEIDADRAKAAAGNDAAAAPPPPAGAAAAAPPPPPAVGGFAAVAPPPTPAAPRAREETMSRALADTGSTIQWRVSGARVEQSVDRGTTWTAVYTAPSVLTAIAAPSPAVVWVTGRGGVVLRSTDGRGSVRLSFPETVDLAAVRATDGTSATVTTTDGRTLTTTDAGATWRAPLQDF